MLQYEMHIDGAVAETVDPNSTRAWAIVPRGTVQDTKQRDNGSAFGSRP